MNASPTDAYVVQNQRPRGTSPATMLTGLTLLVIGIVWLLDASEALTVSWYAVFAIALVMVGLGLVVGSFSGEHGGLVALGIVLTVLLTGAAWADIRFDGGLGDRDVMPASFAELEQDYNITAGNLTIDLRQVDFPPGETTTVNARVGAGEMVIYVPQDVGVRVEWRITAGEARVFGSERSGVFIEGSNSVQAVDGSDITLKLDLIVTTGTIEVRQ